MASLPNDLLSALPLEIKRHICEFLCDHCIHDWVNPDPESTSSMVSVSLQNLCLTSKTMKEVAQPILYHFLFMSTDNDMGDSLTSITAFLKNVWDTPYLAQQIKSLSLQNLGANGLVRDRDLTSTTIRLEFLPRCYEFYISRLLEKATRLEELELNCEGNWKPDLAVDLPCLRELSIHNKRHSGTLTSEMISAFLINKPKLSMLTLSDFVCIDDSISEAVLNIRELHMLDDGSPETGILPSVGKLVKAMPQLESFLLFSGITGPGETDVADMIERLLIRSQTLKSLKIHGCAFRDNLFTLKRFSKLEKLALFVYFDRRLQESYLLSYPDTLKQLLVCDEHSFNPLGFNFDEVGEPLEINSTTGTFFLVHPSNKTDIDLRRRREIMLHASVNPWRSWGHNRSYPIEYQLSQQVEHETTRKASWARDLKFLFYEAANACMYCILPHFFRGVSSNPFF